jgi:hypothetical protein
VSKSKINAMPFNTKKQIKHALTLMTEKGVIETFYNLVKERNKTSGIKTMVCVDIDKWIEWKKRED